MGSAQSARRSASARDEARDAHRGAGSQLRRWRAILPYLGGAREVAPQLDPFVALPREVAVAIFTRLSYTSRIRCTAVCRAWRETLRDRVVEACGTSESSAAPAAARPAALRRCGGSSTRA